MNFAILGMSLLTVIILKIFVGEMLIRTLLSTLFQIFYEQSVFPKLCS